MRIRITAYTGIALAMPVILWQIWRFVAPGALREREASTRLAFVGIGTALFAMRRRHRLLDPARRPWSSSQTIGGEDNFTQFYTPDKYLKLIVYMMLAFGIGFEFPILLVIFLQLVGRGRPRHAPRGSGATPS